MMSLERLMGPYRILVLRDISGEPARAYETPHRIRETVDRRHDGQRIKAISHGIHTLIS
jgi:hypothetical protein